MGKMKKNVTKEVWENIAYGIRLTFSLSKIRVVCAVLKKVVGYLLWVFYSAFFVRFVIDSIENEMPITEIILCISLIGLVSLALQGYQYYCDNVIFPLQDIRIYQNIYKKIYRKSENIELECFEKPEFYNKFSISLDNIGNKLGENVDNMSEVIGGLLGGVLSCWAMIEIDPWTIFFLIAPLIGNFFFAPKMNKIFYNRYKDGVPFDRKISYVNRVMYLSNYAKEMRIYNIFNVIKKMLSEATDSKSMLWEKYFNRAFIVGVLQYFFSYVVIFEGILLYGGYLAIVGKTITFSQMAVLTSVMVTASWVWVRVINSYNKCVEIGLVLSDLKEFLEYTEKIPEDFDGIHPDRNIHKIEFRNVSFSYDGEKKIIDNISFILNRKEKVALVGHNGAGKTTIIKLLLRLYDPTEGSILVNDIDIRKYNLCEYRELFSCAFQDYEIFSGSVKDNVLLGRDLPDEKIVDALKKAGIYKKIDSLPYGIDTILTKEFDDEGVILSGGEFQKIVCARVFVDNTKVSLFDEPSSALDPISENELFDSIIQSVEEQISVFISHRLSCVKNADFVFMLEKGKIVEQGNHDELMKLNGVYCNMYKTQEKNYFALDNSGVGVY